MKKVLFLAASVLGSALLFCSCNNPENPDNGGGTAVTAISVVPTSYTFTLGDEPLRLVYTLTPKDAKADLEWTSSNEEVATVDNNGSVTALNVGQANITVTVKGTDLKAVCSVTVSSLEDNLEFREAYVTITDYDSINTIAYHHGTFGDINVHKGKGRVQLFTKGLYFNASGKLDGSERGGWIYISTPIALAYADENKENAEFTKQFPSGGVMFSLGEFAIDLEPADTLEVKWHHAHKGVVDNTVFMGYLNKWLTSFNEKGEFTEDNYTDFVYAGIKGITGTTLNLMEYGVNDKGEGEYSAYPNWLWKYTPNAIVTSGEIYIGSEEGSSKYMNKIEYMNLNMRFVQTDENGIPGVFSTQGEDGKIVIKSTGVELGEEKPYVYGEKPANAPAGFSIFVDHIPPFVGEESEETIALPATHLTIK